VSRSNPETASNPATRYFEWAAEKGELHYYDKEAKTNVSVNLPFTFLVLDQVSQIGGGVKVNGKYEGYWSNAVKNLKTQTITVRSKGGIVAQGLYADLKERKGLHYVKGLYIAFYDDEKQLQIGYLKLKGSSLGAWFDFTKATPNLYQGAVTIRSRSDVIAGDKGDYYTPVFAYKADVSDETEEAAKELDRVVQEYFKAYFAQPEEEEVKATAVGGKYDAQRPVESFEELDRPQARTVRTADDDIPF
jgi:hypothetical protein